MGNLVILQQKGNETPVRISSIKYLFNYSFSFTLLLLNWNREDKYLIFTFYFIYDIVCVFAFYFILPLID